MKLICETAKLAALLLASCALWLIAIVGSFWILGWLVWLVRRSVGNEP